MNKRVVYTRKSDGGVSVCCPSDWVIDALAHGAMGDAPRGVIERRVDAFIAEGIAPDVAKRFVHAMHFGGCTTAEALALVRDKDCAPHGTAIELWDLDDIPKDRWFRDAWRRSHNGGPISINLKLAKPIQFRNIRLAAEAVATQRKTDLELFDTPLELDWGKIRDRIHAARDDIDLRRVWPQELTT